MANEMINHLHRMKLALAALEGQKEGYRVTFSQLCATQALRDEIGNIESILERSVDEPTLIGVRSLLELVASHYEDQPDSDLDNEQPRNVALTLKDIRLARRALHGIKAIAPKVLIEEVIEASSEKKESETTNG